MSNSSLNREAFEKWHNTTFEETPVWNQTRNLYEDFAHHMAWKGWQAAWELQNARVKEGFIMTDTLIASLQSLLDGPDSSYRCGVHDCIAKISQHEADPFRHTVINVLEVATGIKATNTLIQKFERAIIEENDGSFNPQKKIPLAQIITIMRQHEAEQLTVRGASLPEEGVASPQGDTHALNDCAKDLAEYEHSGDCLGFNKTQLRKLWEFAQKDWSRNEISVSRDIEIERERGNYWKGRLFELDTQRLKEREIQRREIRYDAQLFEVVCDEMERGYRKTDEDASFHDVGALRGYIHSFLSRYIGALPKRESRDESGWAIEHIASEARCPDYFCGFISGTTGWSKDHNLALRFARFRDAEIIRDTLLSGGCHRVAEHMWSNRIEAEPQRQTGKQIEWKLTNGIPCKLVPYEGFRFREDNGIIYHEPINHIEDGSANG